MRSPMLTVGTLLRDVGPALRERADRRDDERVDAAVGELERELDLDRRVAVGIGDQELAPARAEVALDAGDELLEVEVGEAADDHADALRRAAAQRARDRVGAEAELLGRRLHARLRLRGHLKAAQRVGHGCRREAGVLGQLADRRASRARGHVVTVTHLCRTLLDVRQSGGMIGETIHLSVSPGH